MFASKLTIFFLAFVIALVSAAPLHQHHRRTKCNRRPGASSASSSGNAFAAHPSTSAASPSYTAPSGSKRPSEPSPSSTTSESSKETSKPDVPPKSSGSNGSLGGLLGDLFPVADKLLSWTTSSSQGSLPLSDSTFRPEKEIQDLSHEYTAAPDGKKSMKAHYPAGSFNFEHNPMGGFSFYAPGPENVDLTTAKEATFGYSVYFPEGFDFVKGGKLPGLYGGDSAQEAVSCSGGRRDNGCWSARLMWRGEGEGEFYTYLPPDSPENQRVCNVKPLSDCNPTYGASVGRGSFRFATGGWTTVSERIRLNDAGKANGEIELFVNGKSVVNVDGLVLRDKSEGRFRGMQMQTFFGGSSSDFATPKNQDVYFSDFSIAITEKL